MALSRTTLGYTARASLRLSRTSRTPEVFMSDAVLLGDIATRGYVHPEVLVSTEWVAQNLQNPDVRIVESNEDSLLYPSGHVPGSVQVDWALDLNDPIRRDYLDSTGFEKLMAKIGATRDTTLIFYGDKNNWWACYA